MEQKILPLEKMTTSRGFFILKLGKIHKNKRERWEKCQCKKFFFNANIIVNNSSDYLIEKFNSTKDVILHVFLWREKT